MHTHVRKWIQSVVEDVEVFVELNRGIVVAVVACDDPWLSETIVIVLLIHECGWFVCLCALMMSVWKLQLNVMLASCLQLTDDVY